MAEVYLFEERTTPIDDDDDDRDQEDRREILWWTSNEYKEFKRKNKEMVGKLSYYEKLELFYQPGDYRGLERMMNIGSGVKQEQQQDQDPQNNDDPTDIIAKIYSTCCVESMIQAERLGRIDAQEAKIALETNWDDTITNCTVSYDDSNDDSDDSSSSSSSSSSSCDTDDDDILLKHKKRPTSSSSNDGDNINTISIGRMNTTTTTTIRRHQAERRINRSRKSLSSSSSSSILSRTKDANSFKLAVTTMIMNRADRRHQQAWI
ncbi:hypothetical protein FRACYDRAFT_246672 [Fragilariopsis cylindrus CCMP1102]|uniref:Uncharacterized protein n=1 Tax=Fragilariopsis cylindrus CCMP1102 TaxID=635003 RepID=A0A1E7EZ25_9STRA|nr:hypothetical protein FRACYDRAFT_246672 [Fragilariopsis cylindrus CCMP1102]|eukprot:OEU10803.1 hypothetical protein FRACYDRAFT_246672 [Fragilariopsis cylindrus CCMP1102]